MPFCPSCRTEYRADTTTCADCKTDLVAQRPPEEAHPAGERIDVYICFNDQQATRAIGVLGDGNVEGLLRDRASSSFPTTVGMTAQKVIAVREQERTEAVALLREAGFKNAWNVTGGIIAWIDRVDSSLKKY